MVVGGKLYLSGGSGSDELWFNDLFVLNLESLQWVALETQGEHYTPRDCATITSIANWVSEGYYLLCTNLPDFISCPSSLPPVPPPPPTPQYLVLFGGFGGEDSYSDLHFIDITSSKYSIT